MKDLNFTDLMKIMADPEELNFEAQQIPDGVNTIIGRWLAGKMRRVIREAPEGDGPTRGAWTFGPHGRAALNMKKQGAGLGICRLTLFGRI